MYALILLFPTGILITSKVTDDKPFNMEARSKLKRDRGGGRVRRKGPQKEPEEKCLISNFNDRAYVPKDRSQTAKEKRVKGGVCLPFTVVEKKKNGGGHKR